MKITKIKAREILDSRSNPTLEVDLFSKKFKVTASVPSGASTGKHEAVELRDNVKKRFNGKGLQKAIKNVENKIFDIIKDKNPIKQREIDNLMLNLDGTKNKKNLGANSMLAVSLAVAKLASKDKELYVHLTKLINRKVKVPQPFFNVINGGKHAGNSLAIQEFMIVPRARTFKEMLRMGSEVYQHLKVIITKKYGKSAVNVGDEGGFAPPVKTAEEALNLIMQSIKKAGYYKKVDLAIDAAASEFYKKGNYYLHKVMNKEQLLIYYLNLIKKYPIVSVEDPFEQEDFQSFAKLKKLTRIQIVGDDLTVTNQERIKKAIKNKSCNCLLLKVNQIGTLSEALDSAELAFNNGWKVMVSHRSGETEDTFIADLTVALGCGMIKSGAPCRSERVSKYNRLLRISELIK